MLIKRGVFCSSALRVDLGIFRDHSRRLTYTGRALARGPCMNQDQMKQAVADAALDYIRPKLYDDTVPRPCACVHTLYARVTY